MGTFSKIERDFWQDNLVLELTPEEKYFYLYLLTNGRVNALGCYELRMKVAVLETGYNSESIKKYLDKFTSAGRILFDNETQEILIINWHKYNWSKKTGTVNSILKDFKGVKCLVFKEILQGFLDSFGIHNFCAQNEDLETTGNYEEQQETKGETCSVEREREGEREKDMVEEGLKEKKEKAPSDQQGFDQFWKLYPNKKAKAAALRRWKAMKISNETFQAIMEGLQKALVSQEWEKDGGAYIPHPATWLNGGCWEDEYKPLVTARTRSDTPKDSAIDLRRQMLGLGDENG
ncbi:hypothetical protein [Anaerotignum sp.]|uniref:hypothetical protein n=1 Tax=Anaerotignum sp. TaxID=2039241 RepID=UPI002897D649|nr:hypothetical protein [Anaerotignum sp.]